MKHPITPRKHAGMQKLPDESGTSLAERDSDPRPKNPPTPSTKKSLAHSTKNQFTLRRSAATATVTRCGPKPNATGLAWRGLAGSGEAGFGLVWRGRARRGSGGMAGAWLGVAGSGRARFGVARLGAARQGRVRRGAAGSGKVGRGKARTVWRSGATPLLQTPNKGGAHGAGQ